MIELVLVLLVIGLLAAVATPRFAESLRVARLEAAVQQLAAHLRYVRSVALNEGRTATLAFDNEKETYGSASVDFPERIGERILVVVPDQYDPTIDLNAFFDGLSEIAFDFEGVPHVGGSPLIEGHITLTSFNDQFRIVIENGTGMIQASRFDSSASDSGGEASDGDDVLNGGMEIAP